jgi:hypothetical protein
MGTIPADQFSGPRVLFCSRFHKEQKLGLAFLRISLIMNKTNLV